MLLRATLSVIVIALGSTLVSAAKIPPKTLELADQLEVAWQRQNPALVWKLLERPARSYRRSQLDLLDDALSQRGVPSSAQLLVDSRLSFVQQNLIRNLPEPNLRERVLLIAGLHDRSAKLLQQTDAEMARQAKAPPPEGFRRFEDQFWDLHVLANQLLSAERFRRYAADLASRVKGRALENLDADQRAVVLASNDESIIEVLRRRNELAAIERKLRLQRVDYSLRMLERPELDKEKFTAAFAIRLDAHVLGPGNSVTANSDSSGNTTETRNGDLSVSPQLAGEIQTALSNAGDLPDKATAFFAGLHWWLRGRYGVGTEVHGLAKSEAARAMPGGLVWLNMPLQPEPPGVPAMGRVESPGQAPHRRHHLIWAWEDRQPQLQTGSESTKTKLGDTRHEMSTFW